VGSDGSRRAALAPWPANAPTTSASTTAARAESAGSAPGWVLRARTPFSSELPTRRAPAMGVAPSGQQPDSYRLLGFLLSHSWIRFVPWVMEASSPPDRCSEADGLDHHRATTDHCVHLCLAPATHGLWSHRLTSGPLVRAPCEYHRCSSTIAVCAGGFAPCIDTIYRSTVDNWWIHLSTHLSPTTALLPASAPTATGTE